MSQEPSDFDYKDFQGVGPEDFFVEDEKLREKSGSARTAYRGWGELLQHWYAWCENHSLEPITDFREQTRLFVEAEDEARARASQIVFGNIPDDGLKKLTDDEKFELLVKHNQETERQTNEVLKERGYITLFEQFTLTVNPETLEVEKQEPFKRPAQRNVPMYAKALYRPPKQSALTWQDFYNHYVKLLRTEGGGFSDHAELQAVDMIVATSKLAGHLNGFIVNRSDNFVEELQARRNGRFESVRARSRLDLPRGAERPSTTELLEKMHKTLLKHKEESASLLKTHLYLVDLAYKRGGDSPTFTVNMDSLLEAKGYTRRADGSFQASTYREEWGRIATLAGCWLELRRVKEKNKRGKEETFIDETPYWEVRARRRLEEGEALGLETILLEDPSAPIIKAVVIQPGLWWGVSDRGAMNFHLPREVLALPTDGKGNETQRMAVQLAATLALWVRASQNQHAGRECAYSVGALLEASGVKTRLEFEAMHRKDAARLRKYLAGEVGEDEPSGALHHLTVSGAFVIRTRDEEEFWASGRGWQIRFWESRLTVEIPDMGIKKLEKPQVKRRAPKRASA